MSPWVIVVLPLALFVAWAIRYEVLVRMYSAEVWLLVPENLTRATELTGRISSETGIDRTWVLLTLFHLREKGAVFRSSEGFYRRAKSHDANEANSGVGR